MSLIKWVNKLMDKMTLWDLALTKIVTALVGIMIGAYIATFVKDYIGWFLSVTLFAYGFLLYQVFKK